MVEIFHEVPIQCPAKQLFQAISSEAAISEWWLKGCRYEPILGGLGTFPLSDGSGNIVMKIDAFVPGAKQVWRCLEHKHSDWIGTTVTFEVVSESNESCVLRFRHSGWKDTSGVFGRVSFFWAAIYLRQLRLMLQGT